MAKVASVEAEVGVLNRPWMSIQGDVMATCGSCAGEVRTEGGCIVCANPSVADCVLPRVLRVLSDLDHPKRVELSVITTSEWIEQHKAAEVPLPIDEGKKK